MAAIERLGIAPIDVVVVNLYPFARAAAAPETTFDELVEQIDIGGGRHWCARPPRASPTSW